MKIHLNQIPAEGLSAEESLDASAYDLDAEGVKITSPLEVSYQAFLEGEDLFVHLSLDCQMRLTCSRCLAPYESFLEKEIDLNYPIGKARVIDLTDDIRQEIVLEYPMKRLCAEACKGICQVCGQNLNEVECNCENQAKSEKRKTQN